MARRVPEPPRHPGTNGARAAAPAAGQVTLRYLGPAGFSTRSVRTGLMYVCPNAGAHLSVDPRDVEALVLTRLFTRV